PGRQELVRGEQFAPEVRGNEEQAHQDPSDDVAEHELQERHVAGIRHGRYADEGQRARLGGDDGEADGPPGDRSAGEKVIAGRLLKARELGSKHRDGQQVAADHEVVNPGEDHDRERTSRSNAEAAKDAKRDRLSQRPSRPLRSTAGVSYSNTLLAAG